MLKKAKDYTVGAFYLVVFLIAIDLFGFGGFISYWVLPVIGVSESVILAVTVPVALYVLAGTWLADRRGELPK